MLGSRRTKDFQAISGCMLLQNCGVRRGGRVRTGTQSVHNAGRFWNWQPVFCKNVPMYAIKNSATY